MKLNDTFKAELARNFGLTVESRISKEQLIAALSLRIAELLAGNPDRLFSLLYRLDISEQKIRRSLLIASDFPRQIALLIYERQIEKAISRKEHPGSPPDDDLAW